METLASKVFLVGLLVGLTGALAFVLGYTTSYAFWTDTKTLSAVVMLTGFLVAAIGWRLKW